jgi:hypothetical protein
MEDEMKRKTPKPRNPFVQHITKRAAGAHGKSRKAERRAAKINLRRSIQP